MDIEVNYTYNAEVVSVYDGDTMRVNIDMGFGIQNKGEAGKGVILRLYGINAPEMKGDDKEQGTKTRDYVRERVLGKRIVIKTTKDTTEKYGRYLADIYYRDENGSQIHLNTELVSQNLAEWHKY